MSRLPELRARIDALRTAVLTTAPLRIWVVLTGFTLFMFVTTQRKSDGFVPDSRYYVARAYKFAGSTEEEAAATVETFTNQRGWVALTAETLFGWDLVQPRILYPLVSAPFVWAFGVRGMYVVPWIAMLFVVIGVFAFSARRYGAAAALIPSVLVAASFYMVWFGTSMLTEGPAAALGAGIVMTTPLHADRGRKALIVCGVLILALAFTRQAAVLPAAGIATAWLGRSFATRTLKNEWTPFFAVSMTLGLGSQVAQSIVWPNFSVFQHYRGMTDSETLSESLAAAPDVLHNIVFTDFANYVARDRALLLLLLLGLAAIVLRWRTTEAHLLAGALLAATMLNVLNTVPTGFRYAMPILPFVMIGVASLCSETLTKKPLVSRGSDDVDSSGDREDHVVDA